MSDQFQTHLGETLNPPLILIVLQMKDGGWKETVLHFFLRLNRKRKSSRFAAHGSNPHTKKVHTNEPNHSILWVGYQLISRSLESSRSATHISKPKYQIDEWWKRIYMFQSNLYLARPRTAKARFSNDTIICSWKKLNLSHYLLHQNFADFVTPCLSTTFFEICHTHHLHTTQSTCKHHINNHSIHMLCAE